MNKRLSFTLAILLLSLTTVISAQSSNVVDKTVESIMKKVVDRDYEKAYSYVLFLAKIQGNTVLSEGAVLACEEAIDAYTQDLYSRREWQRLVEVGTELAGVPLSAQKKAERRIADAKTELVSAEKRAREQQLDPPLGKKPITAPARTPDPIGLKEPTDRLPFEGLEQAITALGNNYTDQQDEITLELYTLESLIETLKSILYGIFIVLLLASGATLALVFAGMKRARVSGSLPAITLDSYHGLDRDISGFIAICEQIGAKVDGHTGRKNNSRNVARLVRDLSLSSGYSDDDAWLFYAVALARDAGFLYLDSGFFSSGLVDDDVKARFREHVGIAESVSLFAPERFRLLLTQGISTHHENLDGSGHPAGIKGVKLPFIARAIRIAESYDAMVSLRPYHGARDSQSAIAEIVGAPLLYDVKLARMLYECV